MTELDKNVHELQISGFKMVLFGLQRMSIFLTVIIDRTTNVHIIKNREVIFHVDLLQSIETCTQNSKKGTLMFTNILSLTNVTSGY